MKLQQLQIHITKYILPNNKATTFVKVEAIEGRKTGNTLISRYFNITTQCEMDHYTKHKNIKG